jgi:hypothetical protein
MQIDRSDEQYKKADFWKTETLQPDSNRTDNNEYKVLKHPAEISSMSLPIVTSFPPPKYRISEIPSKSTRKSPQTRKKRLPGATAMLRTPHSLNARPVTSRTTAGKQIDRSNEQPSNAASLTFKS